MSKLLPACERALRYYVGQADAYPGMPEDGKAYGTINALFYPGLTSERARSAEGRTLNPAMPERAESTLALCRDLLRAALCGAENERELRTYRVARRTDVEDMRNAGQTVAFTSTSKRGFLEAYADKQELVLLEFILPPHVPGVDVAARLGEDWKGDAEVLLPPWLPVTLEERALTEREAAIRDRQGSKPVAAYLVRAGSELCYPRIAGALMTEKGAQAGARVYGALNRGEAPSGEDEQDYTAWKQGLTGTLAWQMEHRPLRDILQEELDRQWDMIGFRATTEELFDHDRAVTIMCGLLGVSKRTRMGKRIKACSAPRLLHTLTTYLLGCWVRDQLGLSFDALPRIFSAHTTGNAFTFFWALICLCHDLGYSFEDITRDPGRRAEAGELLKAMTSAAGRRNKLGLRTRDLLTLGSEELEDMRLSDAEKAWARDAMDLARKYGEFRAGAWQTADHGVVGGLIFYDHMMAMAKAAQPVPHAGHRDPARAAAQPVTTGYLQANAGHCRFRACSLLMALTIARHNMWTTRQDKPEDVAKYERYGLDRLVVRGEDDLLHAGAALDQMLYFLDFMDTIDPVKHFYVRDAERVPDAKADEKCRAWKAFLLDRTSMACLPAEDEWQEIRVDFGELPAEENEKKGNYISGMKTMPDWLKIRRPEDDGDSLTLYFPRIRRAKGGQWPFGITEDEVVSLCLYEGCCDSVRPTRFYRLPNAYQTFNLLMMRGLEGERARIGAEGQQPHGLYIQAWEETLRVLLEIFSAQCKYGMAKGRELVGTELFRVDRQVNTAMMRERHGTFAFTSTSKAEYLRHIAANKKNLTLLNMRLNAPAPLLDYHDVLGDDYVYMEEEEVLLPPCLRVEDSARETTMSEAARELVQARRAERFAFDCGEMDWRPDGRTEEALRDILNAGREQAASTLELFRENPKALNVKGADEVYRVYIGWKEAFQALLQLRMRETYERIVPQAPVTPGS